MMSVMSTPRRTAPDSPSRQLLFELNQLFISDQAELLQRLDRDNAAREKIHRDALNAAAAAHEKVRQSVELERKRLEEQVKAERERRDAEARKEIEQLQRERAAREAEEKRLEVQRAKERENEKKRLADLDRQHREINEAARIREQKEREQAEQRRRDQEAAAQKQRQQPAPVPTPVIQSQAPPSSTTPLRPPPTISHATPQATTSSSVPSSLQVNGVQPSSNLENEHREYLQIHDRLKSLRSTMTAESKKNPSLKESMGEMRRQIRKCVGQLTHSKTQKGVNNQSINALLQTFKTSLTIRSPSIAVSPYLPSSHSSTNTTAPSLLLYLLNIFSKACISQWVDEAGVNTDAADPVGVVASTIFANPAFQPDGTSLLPILLAKYHKTCPILFGIFGPENTAQGKERLAWWRNEAGGYVTQQQHFQRMTGLSAGYASLSLRNYSKSKISKNPYPDYHYWATMARLANTPTNQLTQSHFVVIKGLVDKYEERFIGFYGHAATALLRVLLVDLPKRLPEEARTGSAVMGIVALAETEEKDNGLIL